MSEAEKKWVLYDQDQNYRRDISNEDISSDSREAYKESLRSAIEKEIECWDTAYIKDGLRIALQKMDSVTPKE